VAPQPFQDVVEQVGGVFLIFEGGFFPQGAEEGGTAAGKVGGEAAIVQAKAEVGNALIPQPLLPRELSITQKYIEVLRGMDLRFQLREDKN